MARDEDFYELALRFPEAVLALLGLDGRGYRARALELKQTSRRLDAVFLPRADEGPHVLVEMQRRRDPWVLRNLLK